MPRKRNNENRHLPSRWRFTRNAYYFQVPPGTEHLWDGKQTYKLGNTLHEAYKLWANKLEGNIKVVTLNNLFDRYLLEVVPTKAPVSQKLNVLWITQLKKVFGEMHLEPFPPKYVYQYVELRSKKQKDLNGKVTGGKTAALREIEVLSHAYTKAVEWGYINKHPFKGEVRLENPKPRNRYIEDWEVIEMLNLRSARTKGSVEVIKAYIRLKLMTGMAKSDLLRLTLENLKDDGIHIMRRKTANTTGKRTIYQWTPELKQVISFVNQCKPVASTFLFCTREGKGYFDETTGVANGWDSSWQRFVERVLKETKITERFTEHDLRAKCASDATSLEHARALLSHADARTTDTIYRRKPELVKPGKLF